MIIEIKVPSPGESVTEVEIASWLVKNGDFVEKDQEIAEIESDKATLTVVANVAGKITIVVDSGIPVKVGEVICTIDAVAGEKHIVTNKIENTERQSIEGHSDFKFNKEIKATPLAISVAKKNNLDLSQIKTSQDKVKKGDVLLAMNSGKPVENPGEERKKMSMLRRKLSERLVAVKNQTAMLTTFNEIDMNYLIGVRNAHKDAFLQKFGVKLGFMSFFTKAVTASLEKFPEVNAFIDDEDIVYHNYCNVGIAVQTDKGLMVPVLRNAEKMNLAEIEKNIAMLADKGRQGKISVDDLTGGTFTISNGGVFGSLFSTPILNPPQSGILGMHNILERPVAVNGKVEIRPMMYIALSYDHRIIDGRDSVGFLLSIKKFIEDSNWINSVLSDM